MHLIPLQENIKKLLYRTADSVELLILKMILLKRNPVLDLSTIPQLCYKGSYLCIACQRSLLKFKRLEEELDGIITILAKIGTYSNICMQLLTENASHFFC